MSTSHLFSILLVLMSVLVVSHIVHNFSHTKVNPELHNVRNPKLAETEQKQLVMSDRPNNLFWFIQITDIHLSLFYEPSRTTDFRRFCSESIRVIQPDLVLVSGDLTDGKTQNKLGSRQYIEEWNTYNRILHDTNAINLTQWLDLRGNHDAFNVPNILHEENRFGKFGVQGPHNPRSYLFTLRKPFGNYSFIGLDACPSPGLKRPLNFFGSIDLDTQAALRQMIAQSRQSNHTFWFGHYPTSTIISPKFDLRETIGKHGFAYLCGHLHTFMDLVPRMYTIQSQGFFELELADWRDNRYFRIVAVDHDLVSFVDVQMTDKAREWPVVLITNPKHANFLLPIKEPVLRITDSTHIRILAWSKWPISTVTVHINDIPMGNAVPVGSAKLPSPLYVLPWNASHWSTNLVNTIAVHVRDVEGNERKVIQPFVINRDPLWKYELLPGFFLRSDHGWNLCLCFYLSWLLLVTVLLIPRCLPPTLCRRLRNRSCSVNGLFRLSLNDQLLYPILIYLVYQITCPIFMGFLLDGHFGIVFVFGIFVDGTYIQEPLTYFQELIQMFFFVTLVLLPTILYVGKYRPWRTSAVRDSSPTQERKPSTTAGPPGSSTSVTTTRPPARSFFSSVPLVLFFFSFIFTCLQLVISIQTIAIPYGWISLVLSPGRLGPFLLSWLLTYRCHGVLFNEQPNGLHN